MEASCDILLITFWNTGLWRNWLAHWTVDPGVAGSSPVDPASTEGQTRLPRGVMVAPQILILLVGVRIPAGQPKDSQTRRCPSFFIGLRIKPNCLVVSVLAEFFLSCVATTALRDLHSPPPQGRRSPSSPRRTSPFASMCRSLAHAQLRSHPFKGWYFV